MSGRSQMAAMNGKRPSAIPARLQPEPPTQHDDLIKYIHDSWDLVSKELDMCHQQHNNSANYRNGASVMYYQEREPNPQLKDPHRIPCVNYISPKPPRRSEPFKLTTKFLSVVPTARNSSIPAGGQRRRQWRRRSGSSFHFRNGNVSEYSARTSSNSERSYYQQQSYYYSHAYRRYHYKRNNQYPGGTYPYNNQRED